MKVSTENDNNFGYEKITILVDNIPLSNNLYNVTLLINIMLIIVLDDNIQIYSYGLLCEHVLSMHTV
jgi:hypothetical protein